MHNRALKAIACFFLLMAALTLISRVADNMTLAHVETARVGSGALTHEAIAQGVVKSESVVPLWAAEGLRIGKVAFEAGETAQQGDALMYYERDSVASLLEEQRLALKKLEAEETSLTALEMQADMLIRQRTLDEAKKVLDKARGSKSKREANDQYKKIKEEFDIAKLQWDEKLLGEERRLAALQESIAWTSARILELESILQSDCALRCPFDAVIIESKAKVGEVTGADAAWMLADVQAGLILRVDVTIDEAKYIKASDKAQTLPSGRKEWLDATVVSVAPANAGLCAVVVALGDAPYTIGDSALVKFSKKTDSYRQCIPLTALYGDSAGDYALVVTNTTSVLGDSLTLKRVSVSVLDKDASRAAVSTSIASEEKIVVRSDKPVTDGSRVRLEDDR